MTERRPELDKHKLCMSLAEQAVISKPEKNRDVYLYSKGSKVREYLLAQVRSATVMQVIRSWDTLESDL